MRQQTSLERSIRIAEIRSVAKKAVFDLGECDDYRIMFCASAGGRISNMAITLEDLGDLDLIQLYEWIVVEGRFDIYG